jgi:hypothetical protein
MDGDDVRLAWAAGFFDATGYVGIRPMRMPSGQWFQALAIVRHPHLPSLERFHAAAGAVGARARIRIVRKEATAFMLDVTAMPDLHRLGTALYPHLGATRFQWAGVLEYVESRLRHKGPYTERELALAELAAA